MGIIIKFNNYTIKWIKYSIPMKESYQIHNQEGLPGDTSMEYKDSELFTDEILDRKYQLVTPKQVIDEQHHLNQTKNNYFTIYSRNIDLYLTGNWDIAQLQGFTLR